MVRWNVDDTFITERRWRLRRHAGSTATNTLNAATTAGAGGDFGSFQRSLCNKCHGKD